MKVKEIIKKLEDSTQFKEWQKENYASSLVHVFKMLDEANKDEWQIGYYNKNDTITTFVVGKEDIKIIPGEDIFKKPGSKVRKLAVEDIKIDMDDAIKKAVEFQEKDYPKEKPIKKIVILQKLDLGQVYNITFVTQAFNTLNMKIDSKTGKMVKHGLTSLMDLKAK